MRLNKYIAHCGIGTRREASKLVKKGAVTVNHLVVKNPGYTVLSDDVVRYDNRIITPEKSYTYLLLNKPKNSHTHPSSGDDKPVLRMVQSKTSAQVKPIHKMGPTMLGLLVLTDDEELLRELQENYDQIHNIYHIFLDNPLTEDELTQILSLNPDKIKHVKFNEDAEYKNEIIIESYYADVSLIIGKLKQLGLNVLKSDRLVYAGLTKKNLPRGWSRFLTEKEIILLKHFAVSD